MSKVLIVGNRVVLVDESDWWRVKDRKWCLNKGKYNEGYYVMYGKREGKAVRKVYLHRFIAGAQRGDRVEFMDGNTLNCCRGNLMKNGRRLDG
jgi:hypothetical protein